MYYSKQCNAVLKSPVFFCGWGLTWNGARFLAWCCAFKGCTIHWCAAAHFLRMPRTDTGSTGGWCHVSPLISLWHPSSPSPSLYRISQSSAEPQVPAFITQTKNVPRIKAPSSSWLCVRWRGPTLSTSFSSAHAFLLFHCFRNFKYNKDFHRFSTSSSLFLLFPVLLTVPCFSSNIAGCLSSLSSRPLQFSSFNYHAVLFLLPNSYLYWYFSALFSTTDNTLKCCLQLLFPSVWFFCILSFFPTMYLFLFLVFLLCTFSPLSLDMPSFLNSQLEHLCSLIFLLFSWFCLFMFFCLSCLACLLPNSVLAFSLSQN